MSHDHPRPCPECGQMRAHRNGVGNTTYGGRTVPEVRLCNVPRYVCENCDAESFSIPKIMELRALLRKAYATSPGRLAPRERRFLRKLMGWAVEDTAQELGVTEARVRRWERRVDAMTYAEEIGLRTVVLTRPPIQDYQNHEHARAIDALMAWSAAASQNVDPSPLFPYGAELHEEGWQAHQQAACA